jgi:hypothetical protein
MQGGPTVLPPTVSLAVSQERSRIVVTAVEGQEAKDVHKPNKDACDYSGGCIWGLGGN